MKIQYSCRTNGRACLRICYGITDKVRVRQAHTEVVGSLQQQSRQRFAAIATIGCVRTCVAGIKSGTFRCQQSRQLSPQPKRRH